MSGAGIVLLLDLPPGDAWLDLAQVPSPGGVLGIGGVPAGLHRLGVDHVMPVSTWVHVRPGLVATKRFDGGMLLDAKGFRVAQLQGMAMAGEMRLVPFPADRNAGWAELTGPLGTVLPALGRSDAPDLRSVVARAHDGDGERFAAELAWAYLAAHLDGEPEAHRRWVQLVVALGLTRGVEPAGWLERAYALLGVQLERLGPRALREGTDLGDAARAALAAADAFGGDVAGGAAKLRRLLTA